MNGQCASTGRFFLRANQTGFARENFKHGEDFCEHISAVDVATPGKWVISARSSE